MFAVYLLLLTKTLFLLVNMHKYWNVPWLDTRCKNKLCFVSKLMHRKKKTFQMHEHLTGNWNTPARSYTNTKNTTEILREVQQIHQAVHFSVSYVLPNIWYVSQKFIPSGIKAFIFYQVFSLGKLLFHILNSHNYRVTHTLAHARAQTHTHTHTSLPDLIKH